MINLFQKLWSCHFVMQYVGIQAVISFVLKMTLAEMVGLLSIALLKSLLQWLHLSCFCLSPGTVGLVLWGQLFLRYVALSLLWQEVQPACGAPSLRGKSKSILSLCYCIKKIYIYQAWVSIYSILLVPSWRRGDYVTKSCTALRF